jgi:hypothetical protein
MRRSPLVLTAAVLAAVLVATPACGAVVVGEWGMHRVDGVVSDAVGNADLRLVGSWQDVDGVVGRAVRATFKGQASFATAAHSADLNPGASQFAVAAYLRADTVPGGGHYSPNVVQKGRYTDSAQWKMQLIHGSSGTEAECRFAGTERDREVRDRAGIRLDDGSWHRIVCWRKPHTFGITVDGSTTTIAGTLGAIANGRLLHVGSKGPRAGVTDQFQGVLDCIAYVEGRHARVVARSRVPC